MNLFNLFKKKQNEIFTINYAIVAEDYKAKISKEYKNAIMLDDYSPSRNIESILISINKNPKLKRVCINSIRFIVIDEEFFSFMENQTDEENKTVNQYMCSLSDVDVERLWKKHPTASIDYVIGNIPFVVLKEKPASEKEMYLDISDDSRKIIETEIANIYEANEDDVHVLKNVFKLDTFDEFIIQINEVNKKYFETHEEIKYGKFDTQKIKPGYTAYPMLLTTCRRVRLNCIMSIGELIKILSPNTDNGKTLDMDKLANIAKEDMGIEAGFISKVPIPVNYTQMAWMRYLEANGIKR